MQVGQVKDDAPIGVSGLRKCHLCSWKHRKPYALRMHMNNVHAGIKDFSCEKCSETFLISYDLKKHRAEGHRGQFGSLAERRLENLDLPQIAANWGEIGFEDACLNKVHQIRSNSAIWKYFLVNDVTGHAVCKTCQVHKPHLMFSIETVVLSISLKR